MRRLLRLLKVGEYVATLEIRFDLNLTFLRIVQMVCQLLFLAHLLGCFWFYMAALVGLDPEVGRRSPAAHTPWPRRRAPAAHTNCVPPWVATTRRVLPCVTAARPCSIPVRVSSHFPSPLQIVTWVSSYDDGFGLDAPPNVQYLYSVYWALTTLTTVGYGDITPTNNLERSFSLFALLTGALVFGYMLSSIGSMVAAIDRQAALSEERLDEIKEYMRWRKLPRDLVMRLRRYYSYYYSRKTVRAAATLSPC